MSDLDLHKRKFIEELLESEESIMIHVRADQKDCLVPAYLKIYPTVSISISHYFAKPIYLEDDKIKAELSFDNGEFDCDIPYSSIWACTTANEQHTFWPENLSASLLEIMEDIKNTSSKVTIVDIDNLPKLENKKDNLTAVDFRKTKLSSVSGKGSSSEVSGKTSESKPKKTGHLTLVKK